MTIADTCWNYNTPKIFIYSIIRCSRTTADIDYINRKIRKLCINYNYEFISNMQINKWDLWRDGILLQESGKILVVNIFINSVNNILSKIQSKSSGGQHSV